MDDLKGKFTTFHVAVHLVLVNVLKPYIPQCLDVPAIGQEARVMICVNMSLLLCWPKHKSSSAPAQDFHGSHGHHGSRLLLAVPQS